MTTSPFVFHEPLPELRAPHAVACLSPWVDVGAVGSRALRNIERTLGAQPLGQLEKPGMFFDFTRYRPTVFFRDGKRNVELPNTWVRYAIAPGDHDFIFLHVREPHAHGEDYVEAVLALLQQFSVQRYLQVGAMYDMVPHTRPLLMSGTATNTEVQTVLERHGVFPSQYEGPTSIMTLLTQLANANGIEASSMLVRLPQYAPLDDDFAGALRLLEVLIEVYPLPLDLKRLKERAADQIQQVTAAVDANSQLQRAVEQLERRYDSQHRPTGATATEAENESVELPPAIERFLRDLEN